eukprot:TRINITY_DN59523_c0_g1_i1.p1 TRINITY_DN59523_c0_g1~~TRINITY_DN59523_c0_g1_i1.p1  ORF type:complete len:217 (+),score=79.97 TRINITY_DN59523_c0_g1_i1:84-734(+)
MQREHDYFDVSRILSEEERVVVRVQVPLYNMIWMKLAGGCEEQDAAAQNDDRSEESDDDDGTDLPSGTFVSLPLWVAAPLLRSHNALPTVPKFFDKIFLEKLMSHPFAVNLAKQATPYYYECAHALADSIANPDDRALLRKSAIDVFVARMSDVMRSSEVAGHDSEEIKMKLPELEKSLFEATRRERHAKRKWSDQDHFGGVAEGEAEHRLPPYLR